MKYIRTLYFLILMVLASSLCAQELPDESLHLKWEKIEASEYLLQRLDKEKTISIIGVKGNGYLKISDVYNPDFFVSNGSGLFETIELKKNTDNNFVYKNTTLGTVWLKISSPQNEPLSTYLAEARHYDNDDFLHPLTSFNASTNNIQEQFKLIDSKHRVKKTLIDKNSNLSFAISEPGILLYRHQIDFQKISGNFDVQYQIGWSTGQDLNYRNYSTRPEVSNLYSSSCFNQFGQRRDTFINITEPGNYTFLSDTAVQASFYFLSEREVLFNKNARIPDELTREIEQIQNLNEIVNNFNLFIDNDSYQNALAKVDSQKDKQQVMSLIRSKHSFFKSLHPITLDEQKMLFAYYSIYSEPELLKNRNNKFYLNENLTDSLTNKLSSGYFYSIDESNGLNYELPKEMFESKLRIAVTNIKNDTQPVFLEFNTGEVIELTIENSFTELKKRVNFVDVGLTILNQNNNGELATLSKSFSSKKPAAPYLRSVTGLINIPNKASSFSIRTQNKDVWFSVAYPHRTYYRPYEYTTLEESLTNANASEGLTNFLTIYSEYKNIKKNNYSYTQLVEHLETLDANDLNALQTWTPYYREIYNEDIKIPAVANQQVKLFSLSKLRKLNSKLKSRSQARLRKETLLSHAYYSPQRKVREFAFNEFLISVNAEEKYWSGLKSALVMLARHGDYKLLDTITHFYQKLDHHKKSIFYSGLSSKDADIEKILASLFNQRQWDLFDKFVSQSKNSVAWNNLSLFHKINDVTLLGEAENKLIEVHGKSWVNEDRFILNYDTSKIIRSLSTLTNKQIRLINNKDNARLLVKGPQVMRIRVAHIFPSSQYSDPKHTLLIRSGAEAKEYNYKSIPAANWITDSESMVGTFGFVDINVPEGIYAFDLSTPDDTAYIYAENQRNLLGLNLESQDTADVQFVKDNAQLYSGRGANRKRLIGYIKSGCSRLRPLLQRPLKTFQPVQLDLGKRGEWLDAIMHQSSGLSAIFETDQPSCSEQTADESCIENKLKLIQQSDLNSALETLEYIDKYRDAPVIASYRSNVFEHFDWNIINNLKQNDGRIILQSKDIQEDSEYINTLQDDFSNEKLGSLYITGNKVQGFKLGDLNKVNNFSFKRLSQNPLFLKPVTIMFQVESNSVESIQLDNITTTRSIRLDQNENTIRFWLNDASADEYISIEHEDTDIMLQDKEYHVASLQTPVILEINGPQRLKIVSQEPNGIRKVMERNIASGLQSLSFTANKNSDDGETYYRFFKLQANYKPKKDKNIFFDAVTNNEIQQLKEASYVRIGDDTMSTEIDLLNTYEIHNTKARTFDVAFLYGSSLDEDQDNLRVSSNNYFALDGQYRYYNPDINFYWSGDAQLRSGEGYSAAYASAQADWHPQQSPLQYSTQLSTWLLSTETNSLSVLQADASAAYSFNINEKHALNTTLSGFYRTSTNNELTDFDFESMPSDIWSSYKNQHKMGFSVSQRWGYNLFKDAQVFAIGKFQNNENLVSTDYFQIGGGYKQLYDTWAFETSLTNRQFLSDRHRQEGISSNRFKLGADWLFKADQKNAYRLKLSYYNNFSQDISAIYLGVSWILHNGNYLQDYRPDEYSFRKMRSLRLQENSFDVLEEKRQP